MNTPLNPDAIEHAIKEVYGDGPRMDWPSDMTGYQTHRDYARTIVEQIASAYLAVAQPVVNKVDYLATPRGHYDAWTDTGEGYTQRKGWTLTCLWCGAEFTGATKGEALKGYEAHEAKILQLLRVEDDERAKNRPEVKP